MGDVNVTDFYSVSTLHNNGTHTASMRGGSRLALMVSVMAFGLAGCETAGGLLGNSQSASEQPVAPVQAAPQSLGRVALAPIIGAPEAIAKQMTTQLTQSGERQRVTILGDRDPSASFTLRGYVVASRDKAGTKLSYIWDVADGAGKRVNRITGEEVVAGTPNAKDPWAGVTPAALQSISDKTVSGLAAWLPSQGAATPVALAPTPPASGAGAGSVPPPATPAVAARPTAASNQQTAALPPSAADALGGAPVVSGAPGDGNGALAQALQRELSRQGVNTAGYRVEGQVALGAAKDGRQPIQIDWRVKDAQGKSLGTVSQKNEIPPGSLDGTWGKTADAAAAAAAQGIAKLLPQQRAAN